MLAQRVLVILAGLGALSLALDPLADLDGESGEVSLLQHKGVRVQRGEAAPAADQHYWPLGRGQVGHFSQTPYTSMPQDLNKSLLWHWDAPDFNNVIWGVLIDSRKNLYIASVTGIWKMSPTGETLWYSNRSTAMPALVGNTLIGMRGIDCEAFALDLETGEALWTSRLCYLNGPHGDFLQVHNGVAVIGAGEVGEAAAAGGAMMAGSPSTQVVGMSVEDGRLLWKFQVDCGLWNVMALFPDEDTTIFQTLCGSVYRVGLRNGTQIWHSRGSLMSYTDGGAMIGPDGSTYTCSNPALSLGLVSQKGVLRKYRLSDGARLWESKLPYPCVNFPAVSMDGKTVVVGAGALSDVPKTREAEQLPEEDIGKFYQQQATLMQQNKQRSFYHLPDMEGAIMGFDAATGNLVWQHDVPPYGNIAFAGDEERALRFLTGKSTVPHCWPSHWSAPTLDRDGTVYIGRSTGEFYAYSPTQDKQIQYHTGDGILMAGAAFAPKLMVVPTCSSVSVFRMPE